MNFNADGYLEAGLHDLELEAIIEHFVTAFPHSSSRETIMDGYKRHRSDVASLGIVCTQLLDGSFVSSKADPGDIDMVGFMDMQEVDALGVEDQEKLRLLFSGPQTKGTHFCDAYFVPTVPKDHPNFNAFRSQRKYWMGEFGYDREDRPKGMIKTEVAPLLAPEDDQDA